MNGRGRVAIVTGASRGLGHALTQELAARGWQVVVDARDAAALERSLADMPGRVIGVPGDVADRAHREELARIAGLLGRVDLLVNNASAIGPSPQPPLDRYPLDALERVYRVNVVAPVGLIQLVLPALNATGGTLIDVTSDAAVEPYAGWGGYGSSKAALDQITAILAAEQPGVRVYAFDPGDMNTQMHQEAEPGEDLSHLPAPESVVPALLRLIDERPPSGRYRSSDLLAAAGDRA